MTVSSTINRITYNCEPPQKEFPFNFKILAEENLLIVLKDENDTETILVLNTDYSVNTGPWPNGGTVTTLAEDPYESGNTLTIIRQLPFTQGADYIEGDSFPAETHEEGLDRVVMLLQGLAERLLKLKTGSSYSDLTVPNPIAGRYLRWKEDLSGLENCAYFLNDINISDYIKTLLDDETAIAARNTLNVRHDNLPDVSPDDHHVRYTDGEAAVVAEAIADALIATHALLPSIHHLRYTDAEVVSAIEAAGFTLVSTKVISSADEDLIFNFGRASIFGSGDQAFFAHRDKTASTEYAFKQDAAGYTYVNAGTGKEVKIRINNGNIQEVSTLGTFLNTLSAGAADYDKFVVADPNVTNLLKYRTGAQVLSDIGALSVAIFNNHHDRHHVGGADLVNHDSLTGFLAAEHLSLPNTIANVLSNHTKAIHDALGLSHDSLVDVSPDDHHVRYTDEEAETVAAGLIATHALLPSIHHLKYTNAEARAAINNIFGADGKADADIDLDTHKLINVVDPVANQDADTKKGRDDAILTHKNLATAHQDAPALILTHKGDVNAHHAQAHTLASHSTKAHSELTGVTSNQHHAQLHADAHKSAGGDSIKLDELAQPTDILTLNASTFWHGLLKKLSGSATEFINGMGIWVTPDHGDLTGLGDDDHSQYYNAARHTKAVHDALGLSHDSLVDVSIDDHHARDHAATHGPAAADALKLDDLATPDDNVDLNSSITKHGLLKKLDNDPTHFMDGEGNWSEAGGTVGDGTVSQVKLKTAEHTQSILSTGVWSVKVMTYAEYAFALRFWSGDSVTVAHLKRSDTTNPSVHTGTSMAQERFWLLRQSGSNYVYGKYRYVQASGEIYWLWFLRDKHTKELIEGDGAPDVCCWGLNDLTERPQPFINYDPDKHEIILVNPSKDELTKMYSNAHGRPILQVFLEDYEIDDESEAEWPTEPCTTKILHDDAFTALVNREPVEIVKRVIPRCSYVLCREGKLKKKPRRLKS